MIPAFDPDVREYTLVIPDNLAVAYVWATLDESFSGQKIEASYQKTNGSAATVEITSAADKGKALSSIIKAGILDTVPLTISIDGKEAYKINIVRQTVLKTLKITVGGNAVTLSPIFNNTKSCFFFSISSFTLCII